MISLTLSWTHSCQASTTALRETQKLTKKVEDSPDISTLLATGHFNFAWTFAVVEAWLGAKGTPGSPWNVGNL